MTRWFYLLAFDYFRLSLGLYVHPRRPRHFTKLINYFHNARGRHHRSQSAVCGLLRLQCEIRNLHFCVFWSTGSPCGSGLACNSAWNVMQRTVLYSQTVLWAGNNTHTRTNVPVCFSSTTSSLPPFGFILHLRLHLFRCFHISCQTVFLNRRCRCPFSHPPADIFDSASVWLASFFIFFTWVYLCERSQYDSAGLESTCHRLENPLVLALCCLLLLPFIFPCPLILYNQQQCIPLYRKKKTKTSESLSILTPRWWKHRQLFVPRALKRRKWLQMWGPYKATSVLGPASLSR